MEEFPFPDVGLMQDAYCREYMKNLEASPGIVSVDKCHFNHTTGNMEVTVTMNQTIDYISVTFELDDGKSKEAVPVLPELPRFNLSPY